MRGGYGTSDRRTLAERSGPVRRTSDDDSPAPPAHPARHCFVDGGPALLVEWRRGATEWEGRVVSVSWQEPDGWCTLERWLPESRLRQG